MFVIELKEENMMENREYIAKLISHYVFDTLTFDEEKELLRWRDESAKNEAIFQEMTTRSAFEEDIRRYELSTKEIEAGWRDLRGKTIGGRRSKILYLWPSVAAAVVILLLGTLYIWRTSNVDIQSEQLATIGISAGIPVLILEDGREISLEDKQMLTELQEQYVLVDGEESFIRYNLFVEEESIVYHKIKIPYGCDYKFTLSDGSLVHLNAGSELRYPAFFPKESREVYLEGEGYFEVAHDPDRPFTVYADSLIIKVLGTDFGVRSYPGEQIFTTLAKGSVMVGDKIQSVKLSPGEQALYDKNLNLTVRKVEIGEYLAWREGRWSFDNIPLSQILIALRRWYDFDYIIENKATSDISLSFSISKPDTVDKILELMEETGFVKFKKEGKKFIVQ